MGCGSCGNNQSQIEIIRTPPSSQQTKQPISIRPASIHTKKIGQTVQPVFNVKAVVRAKYQQKSMTTCPACRAPLMQEVAGSGPKNRMRCARCQTSYVV